MIHVPDVSAAIDWYSSLGLNCATRVRRIGAKSSPAALTYGNSEVMLNAGGKASRDHRRESSPPNAIRPARMDLYVLAEDADDLRRSLQGRVEVVEDLHDTFYGMREFTIRDLKRFWITFAQPLGK